MLDSRLDLADSTGLSLTDEWLDLGVDLSWSVPGGVWCFPVETVSLNVAQYEGVYQSSSVTPHWIVTADASRRWEVTIRWTLDRARRPGAVVEPEPVRAHA